MTMNMVSAKHPPELKFEPMQRRTPSEQVAKAIKVAQAKVIAYLAKRATI